MPYYQVILLVLCVAAVLVWMKKSKNPWGILGIAFIVGISIFSIFFLQSRKSETSLRVVGYASKLFESDLVKWTLSVQRNVGTSELKQGYGGLANDIAAFKAYLIEQGITDKDISIQPPTSYPMYDNYGNMTSYNINQSVFVLSKDLDKIDKLSLNAEFFANRGMLLQNSQLQYLFTELPELKKQLLAE
ncbi:MAG TPA: SIMPL domain-containing protein, partial [Candidatus Cloacimonadota bacterium]|nr:SIMPL domain-containing protein [Candidatus Cloacimonadota bacterium]